MRFFSVVLILVILVPVHVFSQSERVPRDVEGYYEKVALLFEETNNSRYQQEAGMVLSEFDLTWNSGFFSDPLRTRIYEISDVMIMRRIPEFPHFLNFIAALNGLKKNVVDRKSMELWFNRLDDLSSEQKFSPLTDFIEYSRNFLEKSILNEARNRTWYFRHGNYKFEYDSVFVIAFNALDLFCATRNDSTEVRGTKGRYYISDEKWVGRKGRVYWNRVGLSERHVYADLSDYTINTEQIRYEADSVMFYNKEYFDHPIPGMLEERISSSPASEKSSYPRFHSYEKGYYFDNLLKDVDYHGGVAMHGADLLCSGTEETYARLNFRIAGKYDASFRSPEFRITNEDVTSSRTIFTSYHQDDSIYHPKLRMKYDLTTEEIRLYQVNDNNYIPFYDSYHRLDIYAEALYWMLDSNNLTFQSIRSFSNQSSAVFESDNFFSERDYYSLQGLDPYNPLILIRNYTVDFGTRVVQPALLAEYMKKPEEQAISLLLLLEGKGFLVYDQDKREAMVKDRLFDYIKSNKKQKDHDVMRIISETSLKSNAILDMSSFKLTINGVPEVFISDAQKVFIFPADGRIEMRKNRDFSFIGKVRAGLFEFYSGECSFEYDSFRLNLPTIDSIDFLVKKYENDTTLDESLDPAWQKNTNLVKVRSVLENLSGYILIDKPDNKSGLISYPDYPIFTSQGNAYVYYDDHKIYNGVYDRERFYYELDPFVIDSLDDFSTDGIEFTGYLASADIMPLVQEPLKVMSDYYLGFNTSTPQEGMDLYNGKAKFTNNFTLDGNGLTGEGVMDYLTSRSVSNNFIFYPDSTTCFADTFEVGPVLAEIEYPEIAGRMVKEKYLPYSEELYAWNTTSPFRIFTQANFLGEIQLTPRHTYGDGSFLFEKAAIESGLFDFKHHSLSADTSDFFLYTDTSRVQLAFMAVGYMSQMDFQARMGAFNSNGISSLLEFPFNQYVCNMDEFTWDMDENEMVLSNQLLTGIPDLKNLSQEELIDLDLSASEFISVHPEQDSLRFFSLRATYDVDNNIIKAEDVSIIKVADAAIYPREGDVTILEDARIETLIDADILANTATRYHRIRNANVNIFSRNNYLAKGIYDYTDMEGNTQTIKFSTIAVNDSLGYTYAISRIRDTADFMLSPNFKYMGMITLRAPMKFLEFNGGFGIIQDCYNRPEEWVAFDTVIDPADVRIPVADRILNQNGEELDLSVNYSFAKRGLYPSFFERKWFSSDREVATARGDIRYDYKRNGYVISREENPFEKSAIHPYMFFDTRHCAMKNRGRIDLGIDMPYVDLDTYGESEYFMIPDSLEFHLSVGINFFLDFELLETMTDELKQTNLKGVNLDNPIYQGALTAFVGEEESAKAREEIALYGASRRVPQNMRYTIFLTDLKMFWDEESNSYVSDGLLGISNIENTPVNKYVNGYLQVEMRETAPVFNLYIELNSTNWFFFSYRSNIMQTISSHDRYNDLVMNLKPDRRTLKEKDEEEQYEFVISSKRKRIEFLRDMERIARKK